MALNTNKPLGQFLLRLAGVTGLFAGIAGLVLWLAIDVAEGLFVALGGLVLVAVAVALEVPLLSQGLMSRRGAVGGIVLAQIVLASVLVVGVNVFSFLHYQRFDLTEKGLFTLDEKYRKQLAGLNQDTTIVIFQRHTAFGQSPENPPDTYDAAAQRQIVEKVKDLAELFQDQGPRFRVEVLDSHDDHFEGRLRQFKNDSPKLAAAIERTKENSIFFYARPDDGAASPAGDMAKDKGFVQMLSFNDIFQLDRQASLKEEGARNLVLRDQGVGAFVGKILNIQEKRPRIGFAVTHEWLGVDGDPYWGMRGVKKVLDARGIDHVDLVLKDLVGRPVVLTHDEHRYEQVEGDVTRLDSSLEDLKDAVKMWGELEKDFGGELLRNTVLGIAGQVYSLADLGPLPENAPRRVNDKYFYADIVVGFNLKPGLRPGTFIPVEVFAEDIFSEPELERYKKTKGWVEGKQYKHIPGKKITLDKLMEYLEEDIRPRLHANSASLKKNLEKWEAKKAELKTLNAERLKEQKRIGDLKDKLGLLLVDCDLLVVPRLTLWQPERGRVIPSNFHELQEGQVEAIKEFLKGGKPVLFCLGPPFKRGRPTGPGAPPLEPDPTGDGIDALLRDLQVVMPAQAILQDKLIEGWEAGLEEEEEGKVLGTKVLEAPPVLLGPVIHSAPKGKEAKIAPAHLPPIRESLDVVARAISKDSPRDLQLRYPRPVYWMREVRGLTPAGTALVWAGPTSGSSLATLEALAPFLSTEGAPDESAVILSTSLESWNEDNPFPKGLELPKPPEEVRKIPNKGTWAEMRRGPFPVGIAIETTLPPSWFDGDSRTSPGVRLAVLGEGGVFKGEDLSPMKERLLLDVTNWLLGRDHLLARQTENPWSFLRVPMDDQTKTIWAWSMWLGLPLAFIYLGSVVMLKRRMR